MTGHDDPKARANFRRTPAGGLVEAIERLASAGSADDIVEVVRTTARRLIGSDGVAVILREGDECRYVEEDAVGPLWKGRNFPLSSCISGWAMLHRQTVAIPDIRLDERIPQDLYRNTFVRSLLIAPVRSDDSIGAIGAYWAQVYEPSADEVEVLEALTRATATAMENVRLVTALSRALEEAELARDELRHRVKNAYTATQALAALTLPAEHARALSARIGALARAHDLLDRKLARQDRITLRELVDAELEPYGVDAPGRFTISGPEVTLPSPQALAIGLVLNELATNALKYGALSVQAGRLDVSWRMDGGHLVIEWRESDGPKVQGAALESFGSRLLKRLVEGQLGGSIQRRLHPAGVSCVVEVPGPGAAGLLPDAAAGSAAPQRRDL
ncbi:sensor histidine kinase [Phenylobacterium sp.]|jgi:two-component sensor histidine kinase|uniref:sensor histidine kinase n=1 Tax=Phenylobacterium sp. TaxID=1871053 RepID=UPI002F9289C3